MSYILEALKKAQAERQLGNAPNLHAAQPVQAVPPGAGAGAHRKPLYIGLGAGALVVAVAALLMWRHGPSTAPAPQAVAPSTAVAASSGAAPAAPAQAPAPSSSALPAAPALEVSAPPAPRLPAARPARVAEAPARPQSVDAGGAGTRPAPAPAPVPVRAPALEDSLPYLAQLPDAIQRDIPRVAFGGYMYSANPADRLLLVDKALRHEGEEVAPGLVLEKLLPKAAVMNYLGTRYRVPY